MTRMLNTDGQQGLYMARKPAGGKKKKRRRKMKLTLRSRSLKKNTDNYTDQVGWSQVSDSAQKTEKIESATIRHQCTMCGSINEVPRPKRQKYSVQCAYPDCEHVDEVGVL
tara:strand:- start:89 stop:421 length:333 start_codon:yes stop_codon:yes gene_type:complete